MQKRGFTLVELLVVIAIIMMLVAFLFPLISSAREMAHKASCIGNLRQLGLALQMYAEDFHGYYPKQEVMASGIWTYWGRLINPYLDRIDKAEVYADAGKVMQCPSDRDPYINAWSYTSYSYNAHLSLNATVPRFLPFEHRARIAVITDGYAYYSIWSTSRIYYRHDTRRINNFVANNRQGGTCNALFGDIHVENLNEVTNDMRNW